MIEWFRCEDKLPASGERVLLSDGVWVGEGYGVVSGRHVKWFRHYGLEAGYVGEIKYWAKMPNGAEA